MVVDQHGGLSLCLRTLLWKNIDDRQNLVSDSISALWASDSHQVKQNTEE